MMTVHLTQQTDVQRVARGKLLGGERGSHEEECSGEQMK